MKLFLAIGGALGAALLAVFLWLYGAQTAHGLTLFWIAGWPVLLSLLLAIGLSIAAPVLIYRHREAKDGAERDYRTAVTNWKYNAGYSYRRKGAAATSEAEPQRATVGNRLRNLGFAALGLAVLTSVLCVWAIFDIGYTAGHKYTTSVRTVQGATPNFDQRTPFQVASESSARNLQDITGDAQNTKSLPQNGPHGEWDTLVIRRGIFQGYEATQSIQTPLYGTVSRSQVTICKFNPDAQLRLDGAMPHNNINRAIDAATPWNVTWDNDDAYSYCVDGTPIVVVPLKQLAGFYGATWSYFGDAVYNGKSGELRILQDRDAIGKLQGSTYPLSLAADTRNAYQASGSWGDWIQNRSGYDTTSSDADDPNGGNDGEFNLRTTTGSTAFVTPLLPRGSSSQVVALGTTDSRYGIVGGRAPLVVYRYSAAQERQAPSTIENQIRTAYSHMADWSSGLKVYEVIPEANGNWVASLGFRQSVDYRAYVTAAGKVTLFNAQGQQLDNGGNPIVDTTPATPSTPGTIDAGSVDLTKLTPAQLQALGQAILRELAKRSN